MRQQQAADMQMRYGARGFRDQRIGGFLHPIVDELVGTLQSLDQLLMDRRPQRRVHLLLRATENDRKRPD